jgi:hypothetical protein
LAALARLAALAVAFAVAVTRLGTLHIIGTVICVRITRLTVIGPFVFCPDYLYIRIRATLLQEQDLASFVTANRQRPTVGDELDRRQRLSQRGRAQSCQRQRQ